jgi:hypothetical protein
MIALGSEDRCVAYGVSLLDPEVVIDPLLECLLAVTLGLDGLLDV